MKKGIFFLMLLWSFACGQKTTVIPDGVLPLTQMADVLTDIELADAAARENLLPEKYTERQELWLFDVLEKHQTDTATYFRSLQFYSEHTELMDSLYARIRVNLQ